VGVVIVGGGTLMGLVMSLTIVFLEIYHGTQSDVLWQTIVFILHGSNSSKWSNSAMGKKILTWNRGRGNVNGKNDVDYHGRPIEIVWYTMIVVYHSGSA